MSSSPLIDIYGYLHEISLDISRCPGPGTLRALIGYSVEGKKRCLKLDNAAPLTALLSVFDEFYGFRIYDRNDEDDNQLEFSRYRVEFWNEDNPIAECVVDHFEEGAYEELGSR
jgi:hypothetical protein